MKHTHYLLSPKDKKHKITCDDYWPNLGLDYNFDKLNLLGVFGVTKAGKSCFINSLFMHHIVHRIPAKNIYIMSPTIRKDESYKLL